MFIRESDDRVPVLRIIVGAEKWRPRCAYPIERSATPATVILIVVTI
jgi:hypothetical protein